MTHGVEWPEDRVQRMIHLLAQDLRQHKVADRLGVTVPSLKNKLTKLRLAGDSRLPKRLRTPDPKKQRFGRAKKQVIRVGSPTTVAHGPIVRRDPCWNCGTRRDIGCEHTAWEKVA